MSLCPSVPALLAVLLAAAPAAADEWWGRDKALHFGVSAGLAAGAYGGSTLVLEAPWQRALVGGTTALGLGAAKEGYDALGPGDPSGRDFVWDAVGAVVGTGLALSVDVVVRRSRRRRRESGVTPWVQRTRIDW